MPVPADPSEMPSVAARDLMGALAGASGQSWRYHATGTAAGENGSVITSIVATHTSGVQHHLDVTIGHTTGWGQNL